MGNDYWEKKAQSAKKTAISSTDCNLDFLERQFIKKYLHKNNAVLDVGSGDGLATLEFAQRVKKIDALENSSSVIKIAKKNQAKTKLINIIWNEGSVLDINNIILKKDYDIVISKRCLINLANWTEQNSALGDITKHIKPGGLLLLAEGFNDTFENLNNLRFKNGLPKDKIVDFNLYFDRNKFTNFIKKDFEIIEQNNFGIYYFLSHFFYPYMIFPKEPKYESDINRHATKLALKNKLLEEYGYICFYALKRK